ncbi:MAG: hypothetical protein FJ356_02035 [Thaumarchaeota archaeon]|nr:hypothetical protein [Nitrososphaerota archaeon]
MMDLVSYNPEFHLFQIEHDPANKKPEKTEVDEIKEQLENEPIQQSDPEGQTFDSVLIDDLYEVTSDAIEAYKKYIHPKFTGKDHYDNLINDEIDRFFSEGVQQYAFDIEKIIDNMIISDNYKPETFGNYKSIIKLIRKTTGKDSANYLRELTIKVRGIIPPHVRMHRITTMSPRLANSQSIGE